MNQLFIKFSCFCIIQAAVPSLYRNPTICIQDESDDRFTILLDNTRTSKTRGWAEGSQYIFNFVNNYYIQNPIPKLCCVRIVVVELKIFLGSWGLVFRKKSILFSIEHQSKLKVKSETTFSFSRKQTINGIAKLGV